MSESQLPQPTEHHQKLAPFAGVFRATVTFFFGNGQSHTSTGVMNNRHELGGLYLHQDYQGDPSPGTDSIFQGKGYWGYSPTTEQYEGFWIDTASSSMQLEKGTVDESGTVWTMLSTFVIPGQGTEMPRRTVITLIDDNHHMMESYVLPPGESEFKSMEIRYERIND